MKRLLLAALPLIAAAAPALAETTLCTNIAALPATITVPGLYCLKQDLNTSMTTGSAITINANSVTIDFNGYRLGGLGGGPNTDAPGVYALNRKNVTLRNGSIRGFVGGILVEGQESSGHLIEDNLLDGNKVVGIDVAGGSNIVVRRNRVISTGNGRPFDVAVGIVIELSASKVEVTDNFVASTRSIGFHARGIDVTGSANVNVSRNTVLETLGSSSGVSAGIFVGSQPTTGSTVTIADNAILSGTGQAGQTRGISSNQGTVLCLNNTVTGFADGQTSGCTSEAGTFPPP